MPRKKMTKKEFQDMFAKIRNKRHKRGTRGTGGAGNTLENLLGLGVDNLRKADLGFAELKVRMINAISSVKLFTLDRDAWRMDKSEATQLYGTENEEGKKRLYFEMRQGTITITRLKFFGNDESVGIRSPNGDLVAEWSLDKLVETFEDKIKELVVVSAETTMGADGYDYFVYRNAVHYHGISKNKIRAAFLQNVITLNLHIESISIRPDNTWKIKNRGTAFRINDDKLEKLFENKDAL